MKRAARRKDKGNVKANVNRIWYRLRPTALMPKGRKFYSQSEKRAYEQHLRTMQARTSMILSI